MSEKNICMRKYLYLRDKRVSMDIIRYISERSRGDFSSIKYHRKAFISESTDTFSVESLVADDASERNVDYRLFHFIIGYIYFT